MLAMAKLQHKGVFVVPYLRSAGSAKHNGDNVKTIRAVFNLMRSQKAARGPQQFYLLGACDGFFRRAKTFVSLGSDLDKND